MFDFFDKNYERANFKYLFVSPFNTRKRLLELIAEEVRNARRQHDAWIILKVNNLVDEEMIRKLYQASQEGIKIKLIVRGICSLIPGVPGMSENIEAVSIIDRFLEHARVFMFCNDGKEVAYISSADWMQRNLHRRVETLIPIENPTVHDQILDQIMVANMKDNQQSWELLPDGSSRRIVPGPDEEPFNAHEYFMKNPSLSGRGRSQAGDVPPQIIARQKRKARTKT